MLTLITGEPGNGKSALVVSMLDDEIRSNSDRPVFVWGIPGLTLPHSSTGPTSAWAKESVVEEDGDLTQWSFAFPEGSLIVIDEAQTIFRPRGPGSKVPPIVQAFETHRHHGLDFWLVTQKPSLVDSNVRGLCGRHIHLRSTWAGRELLEWSGAKDPNSSSDRATATTRKWKLPKRVFGLYQSASIHTKVKRRLPISVYASAAALLVTTGLAWRAYGSLWGDDSRYLKEQELPVQPLRRGAVPGAQRPGPPGSCGVSVTFCDGCFRWRKTPAVELRASGCERV